MKRISLGALAVLLWSVTLGHAAELKVTIVGATPATGQFLISVFDSEATWMKRPQADVVVEVTADGSGWTTLNIPPRAYGVAIVHDANADGKINTNVLGIPTEAFGFSNNAKARFGPPRFERAAFEVGAAGAKITIRLDREKHGENQ